MIDTHCHLDQYADPLAVARAAEQAGITTIAVTGLPSHFAIGQSYVSHLRRTRLALGLHPLLAEYHEAELLLFEEYLDRTSYIGEIGLDFSRYGRPTQARQLESFRRVLALVSGRAKFLSLHSRGAERESLGLLKEFGIRQAVFHWYSGPALIADEIASAGYYFSVNSAMVRSRSGRCLIRRLPRELVLTETDGPYVQINGRPAMPKDIPIVLRGVSELWGTDEEAVRRLVQSNFRVAISHIVAASHVHSPGISNE